MRSEVTKEWIVCDCLDVLVAVRKSLLGVSGKYRNVQVE